MSGKHWMELDEGSAWGSTATSTLNPSGITAAQAAATTCETNDVQRRAKENLRAAEDLVRSAAYRGERRVELDFQKKVNLAVLEVVGCEFLERGFQVDVKAASKGIRMTLSWGHLS